MIDALSSLRSLALGGTEAAGATQVTRAASAAQIQGPDFASVLAEVAAEGVQTLKSGEATALSALQGKASVQEVVQAVMSTEQTLAAAIAVRDKVVAAYQEISRMAM
jgi:flagellar hook-basal body complex protein FliE